MSEQRNLKVFQQGVATEVALNTAVLFHPTKHDGISIHDNNYRPAVIAMANTMKHETTLQEEIAEQRDQELVQAVKQCNQEGLSALQPTSA